MRDIKEEREKMIELLQEVSDTLYYMNNPSVSNQGQCLDGYSALANFTSIAHKIQEFLDTVDEK